MSTQPDSPSPAAVRDACTRIADAGKTVTFTDVAEQTGISRTTLYRGHDLRELDE
jgi:DNA-binding phage protein